jgi:two-component system response regulator AdeR
MDEIPIRPVTAPDDHQPGERKIAEEQPNLSYTVLIIEDAVELGDLIRLTLERMNLRAFHETRGDKALEVFRAVRPDLVLLDIALPDMTGWNVLETMREQQRGGPSPIILVLTAYGDPANRLMGRLQGVQDYLVKPLTPDEIGKAIVQALHLPPKK